MHLTEFMVILHRAWSIAEVVGPMYSAWRACPNEIETAFADAIPDQFGASTAPIWVTWGSSLSG